MKRLLSILFALALPAAAGEAEPRVEQVSETGFKIGKVSFDSKAREIRFPAITESSEEQIEYIVVLEMGRVHETLFITDIGAENLNIAFKLLRYPASPELFPELMPDMTAGEMPEVDAQTRAGARLDLFASWKDGEKTVERSLSDLIQHHTTFETLPAGPWLYTGSFIHGGKFQAGIQGDLIALKRNRAAIINDPDQKPEEENVWRAFTDRLPAKGTPVEIIIRPSQP